MKLKLLFLKHDNDQQCPHFVLRSVSWRCIYATNLIFRKSYLVWHTRCKVASFSMCCIRMLVSTQFYLDRVAFTALSTGKVLHQNSSTSTHAPSYYLASLIYIAWTCPRHLYQLIPVESIDGCSLPSLKRFYSAFQVMIQPGMAPHVTRRCDV